MNDTARPPLAADHVNRIRTALREHPGRMTMQLARDLGVPEAEIVRQMGTATELDGTRWEELIRSFESLGEVHVIISNGAATLETVGTFGNFSTWNEFFNVQSDTLDMHIRWPELGPIFAVEKPSHMNGIATLSVQFYDRSGHAAFKVFFNFGGKATPVMAARFEEVRQQFRKPG